MGNMTRSIPAFEAARLFSEIAAERDVFGASLPTRKIDQKSIALFSVVRNEVQRLPFFIRYYRDRGVNDFYFVDNESTDGTFECLSDLNVTVVRGRGAFFLKKLWIDELLKKYGHGRWCIVADADEFIEWNNSASTPLTQFITEVEKEGCNAVGATLVDMISERGLSDSGYRPGLNPLDFCPYFHPEIELRRLMFGVSPCLQKVPLLKYMTSMDLAPGHHTLKGAKQSLRRMCILHFKFLFGFDSPCRKDIYLRSKRGYAIDYEYFQENEAYLQRMQVARQKFMQIRPSLQLYWRPDTIIKLCENLL